MLIIKRYQSWLCYLLCMIGLAGCSHNFFSAPLTPKEIMLPKSPLYVVATGIPPLEDLKNELVVLDAATLQEANRTELLQTNIWHASLDPKGRLWIAYAGGIDFTTKQVDIFNPDGRLLKTLEACSMPNSGVQFAAGRAFVACLQNGFYGRLAVIDLDSLAVIKTIDLKTAPHFMLLASAATTDTVLIVGDSDTHATLLFVNAHSLEIETSLPVYGGLNLETIIPYQGRFYLLNLVSYLQTSGPPRDLFIIQSGNPPSIASYTLPARAPLYGFIQGDQLYAYHNSNRDASGSVERSISQFDLKTGQSKHWALPNEWDADDMQWVNGQIMLTRSQWNDPKKISGLYTFDPQSDKLTQILPMPGAQLILSPSSH